MFYNLSYQDLQFSHNYHDRPAGFCGAVSCVRMNYELRLFIRGDIEFITENRKFKPNPGDILLLTPGQHYKLSAAQESPYEDYVITFSESHVPCEMLGDIRNRSGCYTTEGTVIAALFLNIDGHIQNYQGDRMEGLLKSVLHEILYYFIDKPKACPYEVPNQRINEIIDYINKNTSERFTFEDLCKRFNCAESSVCQEFQECMQTSVMKYVRLKRIVLAQSLINQGKRPKDIFQQCGFADYSTFFRTYKKVLNTTPSQAVRKQGINLLLV